jgi:hypothetical protein
VPRRCAAIQDASDIIRPLYVEAPGATHETIVVIEEPQVSDFFDKHRRQ